MEAEENSDVSFTCANRLKFNTERGRQTKVSARERLGAHNSNVLQPDGTKSNGNSVIRS